MPAHICSHLALLHPFLLMQRVWTPFKLPPPYHVLCCMQDDTVPVGVSHGLVKALASRAVMLTLVKDGDHRLSRPQDLSLLCTSVQHMLAALRQ